MEKLLIEKVAVITGASSGIGKSISLLFAEHGAEIVVADIDESKGREVVQDIEKAGGNSFFLKCDTSQSKDCEQLIERTLEKYGRLDIAINNAGIAGDSAPIGDYSIEAWDKTIAINLSGVFYGMKHQINAMLKNEGGTIINMASILGKVGFATSSGYVAAKHGIIGLTKNAALEYAKKGIKVNAIGPGFIGTPLVENNLNDEEVEQLIQLHPQGRLGKPEEVAELALWLASEKSSFVNGAYYPIDGGYLSQ